MTTTTVWHYILTLGTYPDGADGSLRMYTFSGTLMVAAAAGRSTVYEQLREALTADHPELDLEAAVVVHSDIQPNQQPTRG